MSFVMVNVVLKTAVT